MTLPTAQAIAFWKQFDGKIQEFQLLNSMLELCLKKCKNVEKEKQVLLRQRQWAVREKEIRDGVKGSDGICGMMENEKENIIDYSTTDAGRGEEDGNEDNSSCAKQLLMTNINDDFNYKRGEKDELNLKVDLLGDFECERRNWPCTDFLYDLQPQYLDGLLKDCTLDTIQEIQESTQEIQRTISSMVDVTREMSNLDRFVKSKLAALSLGQLCKDVSRCKTSPYYNSITGNYGASNDDFDPRAYSFHSLSLFISSQTKMYQVCLHVKRRLVREYLQVLEKGVQPSNYESKSSGSDTADVSAALEAIEANLRISDFDYIDFRQQTTVKELIGLSLKSQ